MLDVGLSVAGYRLVAALGAGPFGRTFRGEDIRGSSAVLKFLKPGFLARMDGPSAFSRLGASVAVHSQLAHPYLARVFSPVQDASQQAFGQICEFLPGQTLAEARISPSVVRGEAPEGLASVLVWFEQLGDVLAWLHSQGMVHGNLKPTNVMLMQLGGEHHVKLLDLSWSAIGVAAVAPGPTSYVSPEQYQGAVPTPRSDQWALGTMLERVFTGGRYRLAFGVLPAALIQVVQRATRGSPHDRFPSMADLVDALREIRLDLQRAAGQDVASSHSEVTLPAGPVPRDLAEPPLPRLMTGALSPQAGKARDLGVELGTEAGLSGPHPLSEQVTKRVRRVDVGPPVGLDEIPGPRPNVFARGVLRDSVELDERATWPGTVPFTSREGSGETLRPSTDDDPLWSPAPRSIGGAASAASSMGAEEEGEGSVEDDEGGAPLRRHAVGDVLAEGVSLSSPDLARDLALSNFGAPDDGMALHADLWMDPAERSGGAPGRPRGSGFVGDAPAPDNALATGDAPARGAAPRAAAVVGSTGSATGLAVPAVPLSSADADAVSPGQRGSRPRTVEAPWAPSPEAPKPPEPPPAVEPAPPFLWLPSVAATVVVACALGVGYWQVARAPYGRVFLGDFGFPVPSPSTLASTATVAAGGMPPLSGRDRSGEEADTLAEERGEARAPGGDAAAVPEGRSKETVELPQPGASAPEPRAVSGPEDSRPPRSRVAALTSVAESQGPAEPPELTLSEDPIAALDEKADRALARWAEREAGAASDPARVTCGPRDPSACLRLGRLRQAAGAERAALLAFERGCRYGEGPACFEAGRAALRRGARERGLVLLRAACEAGIAEACHDAALWAEEPESARALEQRACGLGRDASCIRLADPRELGLDRSSPRARVSEAEPPESAAESDRPSSDAPTPEPQKGAADAKPPRRAGASEPPTRGGSSKPPARARSSEPSKRAEDAEPPKRGGSGEAAKRANDSEPPKRGGSGESAKPANDSESPQRGSPEPAAKRAEDSEPRERALDSKHPKRAEDSEPRERAEASEPSKRAGDSDPRERAEASEPSKRAGDSDPRERAEDSGPRERAEASEPSRRAEASEPSRRAEASEPSRRAANAEQPDRVSASGSSTGGPGSGTLPTRDPKNGPASVAEPAPPRSPPVGQQTPPGDSTPPGAAPSSVPSATNPEGSPGGQAAGEAKDDPKAPPAEAPAPERPGDAVDSDGPDGEHSPEPRPETASTSSVATS